MLETGIEVDFKPGKEWAQQVNNIREHITC